MKIRIETSYTAVAHAAIELPPGKTWDDVKSCYVKWNELHVQWYGSEGWDVIGDTEIPEDPDLKTPEAVTIWGACGDQEECLHAWEAGHE